MLLPRPRHAEFAGRRVRPADRRSATDDGLPGHEEVWADASPITPDEMAQLAERCRSHHIELLPNQNTLGHMERWLRHERHRPPAGAPEGFRFGDVTVRPMTLDPAHPGSLALARDLLGQLLDACPGTRVHVGLDEPFELPPDRMPDYGRYIGALRAAPELAGRQMLMWADIAIGHPELLAVVPDGVTMCVWGYDAGFPFAERMGAVAAAGLPQWVCPGTSSWNSIVGRWTNARTNVLEAADAGRDFGAAGFLITDWGDNGHLQYLPFSWPGFAYGAAVSWCRETNHDVDTEVGAAVGPAIVDLADAFLDVAAKTANSFILTALLYDPAVSLSDGRLARLTAADLDRVEARLDRVQADASAVGDELVQAELTNAIRLVRLLCADARLRMAGADRGSLAPVADDIAAVHRELWLARNRPGGLSFSAGILTNLAAASRGEAPRRRAPFAQPACPSPHPRR